MRVEQILQPFIQAVVLAVATGPSVCLTEDQVKSGLNSAERQEDVEKHGDLIEGLVRRYDASSDAAPRVVLSESQGSSHESALTSVARPSPILFAETRPFGAQVLALSLAMLALLALVPFTRGNVVSDTLNSSLHFGMHGIGRLSGFTLARRKVLAFLLGLMTASGLYDVTKSLHARRRGVKPFSLSQEEAEVVSSSLPRKQSIHGLTLFLAGILSMIGLAPQREPLSSDALKLLNSTVGLEFPSLVVGSLLVSVHIFYSLIQRITLLRKDRGRSRREMEAEKAV